MLKLKNFIKKFSTALLIGLFLLGSFTSFAATTKTNNSVHKVVVSTQLKKSTKSSKKVLKISKKHNIGKTSVNKTNIIKTKSTKTTNNIKK